MRIAIFISHYNLGASGAVINTCLSLAEKGLGIDLFSYKNSHEDLSHFEGQSVCVHIFSPRPGDSPEKPRRTVMNTVKGALSAAGMPRLEYLLEQLQMKTNGASAFPPDEVIKRTAEAMAEKEYCAYIGVEPAGLIWAGIMGGGERVPVIYLSLELYLEDDPRYGSHYYRLLRKSERKVHQRAVATIIQDDERAALLARQNNVPLSRFIIMPVAMKGAPVIEKETFLHERLGIPRGKKILLCIGGISRERLSLETAKASVNLPDDWVMVLHGWCWYGDTAYCSKIEELSRHGKLFLSTEMLPFEQLVRVVASAHAGLTFYKASSENEKLTGAASGKMAHYVQCGLPVIANDFESLRNIIDYYQCGVCVTSPDHIPGALDSIISRYDEMRSNALRCYKERYEITPHIEKLYNLLWTCNQTEDICEGKYI